MKHLLFTLVFLVVSTVSLAATERKVEDLGIKCPKMENSLKRGVNPKSELKSEEKKEPATKQKASVKV